MSLTRMHHPNCVCGGGDFLCAGDGLQLFFTGTTFKNSSAVTASVKKTRKTIINFSNFIPANFIRHYIFEKDKEFN